MEKAAGVWLKKRWVRNPFRRCCIRSSPTTRNRKLSPSASCRYAKSLPEGDMPAPASSWQIISASRNFPRPRGADRRRSRSPTDPRTCSHLRGSGRSKDLYLPHPLILRSGNGVAPMEPASGQQSAAHDTIEMHHVPCDMCGEDSVTPYVTPVPGAPGLKMPATVVKCNSCGLLYTWPRPTQASMPDLYRTYYTTQPAVISPSARQSSKSLRSFLRPMWHWYCGQYLAEVIEKARGAVLEIGCGTGDLLEELSLRGCQVHGVDINPASVQACRERGLPATQGELDTLTFPPGSFDTVILWHALEHLPSPRGALTKIRQLLRPGGRLFIYCPNADSYLARLFGPYWYQWHLPFHFHHFTPASIRRLVQLGAFAIVRLRTVTPEFPIAHSLDLYGRTAGPTALRFLVRIGFHRTATFRLTVAPLFRLLDWCMRGQGECLHVELMKPAS